MTTATQTITFNLEVTVTIEAKGEINDLGVPRSPVWTEYTPTDWASKHIEIEGLAVELRAIPTDLAETIWDVAVENIDDDKWEDEEYEE